MASQQQYVRLAQGLPPRLLRFFQRYPPPLLSATGSAPSPEQSSSEGNNAEQLAAPEIHNPFRARKHPVTGRWHNPVFSLRQQADLVKLARTHGVEELLPPTTKSTEERRRRREEHGLQVKGTGAGQKVKGHIWERTLKARQEKRRQAMLNMPQMIQTWKERGHGRGWKNWPK